MPTSKPRNDLPTRLKGGVFAVVGLSVIAGASAGAVSTHHFVQTAAHAPGVVTKLNAGGVHPEVQFTSASGRVVSYPQGGMIKSYRTGERVTVLYDPGAPSLDPHRDTFGALWLDWISLFGLGAVFVGIGLLLAFGRQQEWVS